MEGKHEHKHLHAHDHTHAHSHEHSHNGKVHGHEHTHAMPTSTCTNISMSTPMAGLPRYTTMTTRATTALMTMTIQAMKRNPMITPTEILIR